MPTMYSKKNNKEDPRIKQIENLRKEAREVRDKNNKIVNQIWEIDILLSKIENQHKEYNNLIKDKETLTKQIQDEHFDEKFNDLLSKIADLEIEVFGKTDVNSSSPFVL